MNTDLHRVCRVGAAFVIAACAAPALAGCSGSSGTPVAPTSSVSVTSLVRQKVKHVFVIIQENHSFDNYFGLYPGTAGQTVENLASSTAQGNDCEPDPQTGGCQKPFLISANTKSPSYVPDAADIDGGNNDRRSRSSHRSRQHERLAHRRRRSVPVATRFDSIAFADRSA